MNERCVLLISLIPRVCPPTGGAKESRRGRHKSEAGSEGSEERSLTPPARQTLTHRPPTASPDQGVVTDDCWGPAHTALDAPLQFKVGGSFREGNAPHTRQF